MSNSQRTPLNPAKPSPRRTLTLVRHLQPDIAAQVCYGRSDIAQRGPQTAATEQLVQQLSALQQTRQFDGFYASPLQRCQQLAETLSEHVPLPILQLDARLQELDFGDWELTPWNDIKREEIDKWSNDVLGYQFPNGESALMMQQRLHDWLRNLPSTQANVLVVCHAGTMRQLLALIGQQSLSELLNLPIHYGEIISINLPKNH